MTRIPLVKQEELDDHAETALGVHGLPGEAIEGDSITWDPALNGGRGGWVSSALSTDASINLRQLLSEKGQNNGYAALDDEARLRMSHVRPTDGSRSIIDKTYGGVTLEPGSPPEDVLNSFVDVLDAAEQDVTNGGKGCVQLPPWLLESVPDHDRFEPRPGVLIRGVENCSSLRCSEYVDTSLWDTTQNGWGLKHTILEGGRDLNTNADSNIIVLHGVQGVDIDVQIHYPGNNGIVARGPGITHSTIRMTKSYGSGLDSQIGGGHMLAATGDGFDSPFDVRHCNFSLDGWDILNGGINMGSSENNNALVRILNDFDITKGPPLVGYAGLRLANGSRGITFKVMCRGVGRSFRCGPCDFIFGEVWSVATALEAALFTGGVYTTSGWRGGMSKVDVYFALANLMAGGNGVRIKSHKRGAGRIHGYNMPGMTALRTTVDLDDPPTDDPNGDLKEPPGAIKGVHIYTQDFTRYRFKIVDHPGDNTQIDVTMVRVNDDDSQTTILTFTCGQHTTDFVAALMASPTFTGAPRFGQAYAVNQQFGGLILERSSTGRAGPTDHRLMIGDVGIRLATPLTASALDNIGHFADADPALTSPNGETFYPIVGEIRDVDLPQREMVLINSRVSPGSDNLNLTRGINGTVPLAWGNTAYCYCHLSEFEDLGGDSVDIATDAVNIVGPGTYNRINSDSIRTPESPRRGTSIVNGQGVVFPPPALSEIVAISAGNVDWLTGRTLRRVIVVVAGAEGVVLKHGTGNLSLYGQLDYYMHIGDRVLLKLSADGQFYEELSPNFRGARMIDLGTVNGAKTMTWKPGDKFANIKVSISADTTYTLTGHTPGQPLTSWWKIKRTAPNAKMFWSPTPRLAGGSAIPYTATINSVDLVKLMYDGEEYSAILEGANML